MAADMNHRLFGHLPSWPWQVSSRKLGYLQRARKEAPQEELNLLLVGCPICGGVPSPSGEANPIHPIQTFVIQSWFSTVATNPFVVASKQYTILAWQRTRERLLARYDDGMTASVGVVQALRPGTSTQGSEF